MKKKFILVLTSLLAALLLVSCGADETTYYTVKFDSNGSKEYQNRAIQSGELIKNEPIPTRAGYEFLGWYDGEEKWDFEKNVITKHLTLTAKWKRLSFTVKFESDGGSSVASQTVNSADKVIRPQNPTKENHVFAGWFDKDGAEWNFDFNRVTDYMTLYAKWEPCPTFTVTFNSDGGTATSPQYVVEGNKISVPETPTKANNVFLGWYLGNEKWDFDNDLVNGNVTLVAKWQVKKTYTVTFDSNGASAVPTQHVAIGGKATKPPTPDRQQLSIFVGWFCGETEWNFDTVITSDIKLTAKWINTYTIKFDTAGAEESIPSAYVNEGGFIQKPQDPTKANSRFVGWFVEENKWNFATNKVTSNVTLTAKWERIPTYTVTFDSNGGSPVSEQHVVEGGYITDPGILEREGFRFDGWYLGNEKWDFDNGPVNGNVTLVAKWQVKKYAVTFDSNGGSTVPTQHVAVGEKATIPPTPDRQQLSKFVGWFCGDTEWNFDTVITEDITLTAKWINIYTIKFDTAGAEESIPSAYVDEGNLIIKPQDPTKANSRFVGWFVGENKWNFATNKVTGNVILTAKWEQIPMYTVTFDSNGGSPVSEQRVIEGGYITAPKITRDGYRFDGWYISGTRTKWNFSDPITKNISLKASWRLVLPSDPLDPS